MRKIFILYRNELYKLFKNLRTLIVLILLVVIAFGMSVVPVYNQSSSVDDSNIDYQGMAEQRLQELQDLSGYADMMAESADEDPNYTDFLVSQKAINLAEERLQKLLPEDPEFVARFYSSDLFVLHYLSEIALSPDAYDLADKVQLDEAGHIKFKGFLDDFPYFIKPDMNLQTMYDLTAKAIESKAISDYAAVHLEELRVDNDPYRSEIYFRTEKEFYESLLTTNTLSDDELYLPYAIDRKVGERSELTEIKMALETNRDLESEGGGPLLPQRRLFLEDKLALLTLTQGQASPVDQYPYMSFDETMLYISLGWLISTFLIMLYLGIQAGSIVSHELETGSIKLLIISPVERWKMMVAKYLALWTTVLVLVVITFLSTLGFTSIFRGLDNISDYHYAYNGVAHTLAFPVRLAWDALGMFIKLVFYSTLVMMLSSFARRSIVTVGLGIGLTLMDFFMTIIYYNTNWTFWYKFMPWVNLDLISRRWSPIIAEQFSLGFTQDRVYFHSLSFSIVYIAVFMVLFIWAGMQAFTKRDI